MHQVPGLTTSIRLQSVLSVKRCFW